EPGRCPACRAARRQQNNQNVNRTERQMFDVICDGCGRNTQVPFQPRGDRPVYCRDCFEANRQPRY
ncbi:MAG: zinc-binding protein, partial [Clostridia bacterium]|nr:zinc-binding protein [Clostridia bacterium]